MAFDFRFPDVGEGISEGEIVRWLVREGDYVKNDQKLVEIETDKAIVSIPSPRAGVILKRYGAEGEIIQVGSVLVTIGEKGEQLKLSAQKTGAMTSPRSSSSTAKEKSVSVMGVLEEAGERKAPKVHLNLQKPLGTGIQAMPAVRKLAQELGVDLTTVTPTGTGGKITEQDVRAAAGTSTSQPKAKTQNVSAGTTVDLTKKNDMWGNIERLPLKGIRKAIAEHMKIAKQKATEAGHFDEIDVTELCSFREKEKTTAQKKGAKLTLMPFIIKAVCAALKAFPKFNASVDDETGTIILKKYYNISFAADTPDGLLTPVIKRADTKIVLDIAREMEKLSAAARDRTIDLMDLKGGTFTITNAGSIGGQYILPILNYPEVAILAVGRVYDKALVKNGTVVARKVMPLSLIYDHRLIDGAEAARFMNAIKESLEGTELLVM